ncbi:OmpA/MotB family protein [Clostridium peptidivorans]|uniref:OmpA/MotB family protein n=1 Tax=Clostridium peptidivorans TaxID=100174 RepID=UPI000BE2E8A9|nr:flagellar motor protein MotB [Clostridium peptidivorans]
MIKRDEEHEGSSERWLLTYSDLITLLMIFFVIMYASSKVDATKYKSISNSFRITFGGDASIVDGGEGTSVGVNNEDSKLQETKKNLDKYLKESKLTGSVTTKIEERGLVVSINDTVFFQSGEAEIREDALKKIIQIGNILKQQENYIRIEGNTDNKPIHNSKFQSNWQLSSVRAANVVQLLVEKCGFPPEKLSSVGYGEHRPIASNDNEEGRIKNRRVDIVIMNSKFNKVED